MGDFSSCLFEGQVGCFNITDNMKVVNETVKHCASKVSLNLTFLNECAYSDTGARLLKSTHDWEQAHTPYANLSRRDHRDANWIIVNGEDYGHNTTVSWLKIVCDAYTGPKPASCLHQSEEELMV